MKKLLNNVNEEITELNEAKEFENYDKAKVSSRLNEELSAAFANLFE